MRLNGSKERKIDAGQINKENVFPYFPWNKINSQIITSLEKFEMISSIAIGIWTIINFIKNLMFNCFNCFLIKQISEGVVNSKLQLTNSSTYLLKKREKRFQISQNDYDATPFKNKQKERN